MHGYGLPPSSRQAPGLLTAHIKGLALKGPSAAAAGAALTVAGAAVPSRGTSARGSDGDSQLFIIITELERKVQLLADTKCAPAGSASPPFHTQCQSPSQSIRPPSADRAWAEEELAALQRAVEDVSHAKADTNLVAGLLPQKSQHSDGGA